MKEKRRKKVGGGEGRRGKEHKVKERRKGGFYKVRKTGQGSALTK